MGYDIKWVKPDEDEEEAKAKASRAFEAACRLRDSYPKEEAGQPDMAYIQSHRGAWDIEDPAIMNVGATRRWLDAHQKVHEAYAAMRKAERSYFRFNIFGMGRYAEIMEYLGMIFEAGSPPPWPAPKDFGLTDEQWEAWDEAEEDEEDTSEALVDAATEEACQRFRMAIEEVLSWHGDPQAVGIPAHKFSTNDGWHATEEECAQVAERWDYVIEHSMLDPEAAKELESTIPGPESTLTPEEREKARKIEAFRRAFNSERSPISGDYWLEWMEYIRGAATHGGFRVY